MMNDRQIEIAETLFRNTEQIAYGTVSVELKFHAGRCVSVVHTVQENTQQKESGEGLQNNNTSH